MQHTPRLTPVKRSIKVKLIAGTAAIVLAVVCILTFIIARHAANLLEREALNQLTQVLNQSVEMLTGFLDVRDANLDVWVSNPLPHAVVSDPALSTVFVPSLRDYFATVKAKEPWIENIYLLRDDTVVYTDVGALPSAGGLPHLLALPATGLTVLNVHALDPAQDKYVIAMKRQLMGEGAPVAGSFLVLFLDLETIQHKLFSQITVGKSGFVSLVARRSAGETGTLWVSQHATGTPVRADVVAALTDERLLADGPAPYKSLVLDHRTLDPSPLAIVGVASHNDVREPVTQLIVTSVLFGSLALLLGIGGAVVFSQRLAAPIRALTMQARQFAAGERRLDAPGTASRGNVSPHAVLPPASHRVLAPPVAIHRTDEIGALASAFQQMATDISHLIDELEATNRTLEQRVTERTEQLAQANTEITTLNAQLQTENLRLGAELEVTRKLQQMLLPTAEELQQIDGLDIACYMAPAHEVGGDYYDVLQHNGRIKIGIGDVTGHGLESGVLMLMTQTIVRTLLTNGETDPVRFLDTLNRTLYGNVQRMGTDKNLTLALLDYTAGEMRLSGQHEEMLVVRHGGCVERVETVDLGFPIGLVNEIAGYIQYRTVGLAPGDGVVLYTDGITEAENAAGEQYGLVRLCAVVGQYWAQPAEVIKEAVVADVQRHIGGHQVYDDVTLVVVKQQEGAGAPWPPWRQG